MESETDAFHLLFLFWGPHFLVPAFGCFLGVISSFTSTYLLEADPWEVESFVASFFGTWMPYLGSSLCNCLLGEYSN